MSPSCFKADMDAIRSHFYAGRSFLLSGDGPRAFAAYAKGVEIGGRSDQRALIAAIRGELSAPVIEKGESSAHRVEAVRRLLGLVLFVIELSEPRDGASDSSDADAVPGPKRFREPVLMMAGGAAGMPQTDLDPLRNALQSVLTDFHGTVVSGGTPAGIPGMVGDVIDRLGGKDRCPFEAVGYLPEGLPPGSTIDERYHRLVRTDGSGFSILEPLTAWADLVEDGIRPDRVHVVGFDGGAIAAQEYRLALALGASVLIVAGSGREADALLEDEEWNGCGNLFTVRVDTVESTAVLDTLVHTANERGIS